MKYPAYALSLCIAACGTAGEARSALNPPTIDTLAGGGIHLTNTGPTAWTDTNGWKFEPVATVNPAEGSPGELGQVSSLALGDDGTIYALQSKPTVIKVYGPDGQFVRDIGREGDGPGEIRLGFMGLRGDTLVLQDPNASRLSFFLTNGTFLRATPSPCCYFWPSLTIDTAGRVYVPGNVAAQRGGFVRYRMDGTAIDSLPMPATAPAGEASKNWQVETKQGNNSSSMVMTAPLQPETYTQVRVDGRLVQSTTSRFMFFASATGKDTAQIFEAPSSRTPLSAAERDSIFEAVIDAASAQWREALRATADKSYIPDHWPAWYRMGLDRAGRLWVGIPGARGGVTRLQVFDIDGRLLGDVPPPTPKILSRSAWNRAGVAVLDEDPDGRPLIRVYRLRMTTP